MNSVIQCLSNSCSLRDFILTDDYYCKINKNSNSKGEIIEEISKILKHLWFGTNK